MSKYTYIIVTRIFDPNMGDQSGSTTILRLDYETKMSDHDIENCMKPMGYDSEIDSLDYQELQNISKIEKVTPDSDPKTGIPYGELT